MEGSDDENWNNSSDSQDSNRDRRFERRGILSYDEINVRNLDVSEIVSRMNQLRQDPSSPESVASTNINRPSSSGLNRPASGTSRPTSGTSKSSGSSQDSSSSSTSRSDKGNLSSRVTFYPEFRKKSSTLDALNLDNIPPACARSAPITARRSDTCLNPFRFKFFGYQSGDAVSSHHIRLPLLISPIRYSRINPRIFPRNPLGLSYWSTPRSNASREFFASEFERRQTEQQLLTNEQQTKPGKFKEEIGDKSENEDEFYKFENEEGSSKSNNGEPSESDPQK